MGRQDRRGVVVEDIGIVPKSFGDRWGSREDLDLCGTNGERRGFGGGSVQLNLTYQ